MRLQLARRINALLKERLVLSSQIETPKDGAGNTEPRLKAPFNLDRKQTANTEVVSRKGVHTGCNVAALVATAPRGEATIKPSSRDALSARASAHRHQHINVRLHHSSNVRAVVVGQQGGGGRDLLLLDVHTERRGPDDRNPWGTGWEWGRTAGAPSASWKKRRGGGGGTSGASSARAQRDRRGEGSGMEPSGDSRARGQRDGGGAAWTVLTGVVGGQNSAAAGWG